MTDPRIENVARAMCRVGSFGHDPDTLVCNHTLAVVASPMGLVHVMPRPENVRPLWTFYRGVAETAVKLFDDAMGVGCNQGLFVGFTPDGDHYVQATGGIKLGDLAFAEKLVEHAVTRVLNGE